ncbi:ribosome maturation factor RimP [Sporosarcina pasteurii]|uniref:Ribosome maturation factor RimP n=1 Tax=Sporosarcina pasteurii TaxID=1474 RepID=A0A380BH13_SPOPA|nr:ribosome maturation factor RimP [Sporosarcina pasteurii]MDS9470619.1 ribosome maturation factor RimP [Sporosarcina pasteurii]QBQ05694.1 ribosome maturation factor RimP [Sporosarcina pasteurii]SUJ01256.1 Ribosome maturation factor RimP [Sporosarcina pasteurii]
MTQITSVVEKMVQPIVDDLTLELVDIEFVKEGNDWFLRVYVDTPEGDIDIDQCALVSERLSEELDRTDPIEQNYFLEVSSPGAERPLKKEEDFQNAIGQYVYIKTYAPIDGMKEFEGYLLSYGPEGAEVEIRIKTRKVTVLIDKKKIAVARLAIDFSA